MRFALKPEQAETQILVLLPRLLKKVLISVFNNDFALQLLINLLSLSFFPGSFITVCSCNVENVESFRMIKSF